MTRLVINHRFTERLADTLHDSAIDLTLGNLRTHNPPDIVDAGVGRHFNRASFWVDFDFTNMRGIRPARPASCGLARHPDRLFGLAAGQVKDANFQIGADHRKFTIAVFQILGRHLERLGGEIARMFDRIFASHLHRAAAGKDRTAAGAAETIGAIGIALHDADAVDRHPKNVNRQLRITRHDALPHRLGCRG